MTFSTLGLTYGSTERMPPNERLAYWDSYNAAALVGLRTAAPSASNFMASQTNVALATIRIAEIKGNEHVVERSPILVTQYPKESIFACHLIKGIANFTQGGTTYTLNALDILIYDTRKPFTLNFPVEVHELLIEIPVSDLQECWGVRLEDLPLKITPTVGINVALSAELRRSLTSYLHAPTPDRSVFLPARTHMLLRSMVQSCTRGESTVQQSLFHILAAKTYIAQHLGDAELCPINVASKVGVSVRHLNRLFATEDSSLGSYIWAQRINMAYRDLVNRAMRQVSISEIAFRWGFSSQAHFCRAISARYGNSPSELRKVANT